MRITPSTTRSSPPQTTTGLFGITFRNVLFGLIVVIATTTMTNNNNGVAFVHGYLHHNNNNRGTSIINIAPGIGLSSPKTNMEIVIFEHTEMGTGGLVHNCPTPLSMGELPIPKFRFYKDLPLMLGCGVNVDCSDDDEEEEQDGIYSSSSSSVALGEVAPWFWLHDIPNISGSYELESAAGPLYMGGNIEEATQALQRSNLDYKGHIKFFREYKVWQSGELEEELSQGLWIASRQDPTKALQPIMFASKM